MTGRALDVEAVRRAIELSATRYCSVGATLSSGRPSVEHRFVVLDTLAGHEETGIVVRLGPQGAVEEGDGTGLNMRPARWFYIAARVRDPLRK